MTDTELRVKGVQVLTESPGSVEAERFIALVHKGKLLSDEQLCAPVDGQ